MAGVEEAGCVVMERTAPCGGVILAGGVAKERAVPGGCVAVAGSVISERIDPTGGVAAACGVAKEGVNPMAGVVEAADREVARVLADERIVGAEIVKEANPPPSECSPPSARWNPSS